MKKAVRLISLLLSLTLFGLFLTNCSGKGGKGGTGDEKRGEPVLTHEVPLYDEASGTFSLTVGADSVEGADLVFYLMMGDSVLVKNTDGKFKGIAPFEEGYNVKLEVQWPDTVIVRECQIMDFIVPSAPVEKLSPEEFAKLVNAKDESLRLGTNEHVTQGVAFHVVGSKMQPQMISDAIMLIETGVWKAVEVVKLEYNEKNLITDVTVRPVGEKADVIDEEDEDYDY